MESGPTPEVQRNVGKEESGGTQSASAIFPRHLGRSIPFGGASNTVLPPLWRIHREVSGVKELKELFGAILICLICVVYYALGVLIPAAFFIGIFGGGK